MGSRTITLHAFCSVKGGVGKSTLAVACAKLLAREKPGSCVVIDADLTGTSLADGLRLCAPKVEVFEDGTLNLDAPKSGDYYTYEETREKRRERDAKGCADAKKRQPPPVYFNDALVYKNEDPSHECRIDALFWKHEQDDLVGYLPSSSLRNDVRLALGWLYDDAYEQAWQRRVTWLLDELSKSDQLPNLEHIIIDLPPGVFGFTAAILTLCSMIFDKEPLPPGCPDWATGDIEWRSNPCLILSQDQNDLLLGVEFFRRANSQFAIRAIVNRHTLPSTDVMKSVERMFPGIAGIDLRFIGNNQDTLGRIFQEGVNNLHVNDMSEVDTKALENALFGKADS